MRFASLLFPWVFSNACSVQVFQEVCLIPGFLLGCPGRSSFLVSHSSWGGFSLVFIEPETSWRAETAPRH